MFVEVSGTRLYFDVEGAGLVPDGDRMRAKPTLLLLHGGPGFDHTMFKPDFSALTNLAQVVYLDQRGSGRSAASDPETWNLAQWGDDVRGFCDALGISRGPSCSAAPSAASLRSPMPPDTPATRRS
jgi:proline iminopeptidase